jgi:UDP-GlcNAc:undecaprenyl-phosphate/decaprenyl-phosphate GlcNAc-1-phosphate transferase
MSLLPLVLGPWVAGAAAFVATPLAIRIARRVRFYDHPREYRRHAAPTPLLGGAAVVGAFLVGAVVAGAGGKLLVLLACAIGLWVLGTIDDLVAVAPIWRVLTETGVALVLVAVGLGWNAYGAPGDGALTVLWVVGLVNGFNLMDNLDGACGSVACASAAGIGTLAALNGDATVAGTALALATSCAVFLRWNLAGPAQIFLGDGGSRPIGLLIAGLAIAAGRRLHVGDAQLVVGALLAGVVILDTALVSVSRSRRGVTLVTGGRDHLSHRLLPALRSPEAVAAALATTQTTLCALAIATERWSSEALVISAVITVSVGVVTIAILDSGHWRPPGIAVGAPRGVAQAAEAPSAAD